MEKFVSLLAGGGDLIDGNGRKFLQNCGVRG